MTQQNEALRLADRLESDLIRSQTMLDAAAELRRLHAENAAFGIHLSERMNDLTRVEAQRVALLEALKELTGHTNERFTGGVWDRARAVIKAVKGEKT